MAKYSKRHNEVSDKTQEDAMKIAKATQKPGQTKEQTKLVSQGIQKGIDQYKKQQKAKARELDKRLKKAANSKHDELEVEVKEVVQLKQHWLPWVLLVISWGGFIATALYYRGWLIGL